MTQPRFVLRTALLLALITPLMLGLAASCSPVRYIMMTANPHGAGPAAEPPLPGLSAGLEGWIQTRPQVAQSLSDTLFGAPLPAADVQVIERELIDPQAYHQSGVLERVSLSIALENGGQGAIELALITPRDAQGPVPVILIPSDCGLRAQLRRPDWPESTNPVPGYCE